MRRLAPLAALLTIACSRDLALPAANHLAIDPAVSTLMPRESFTFTVTGGAGTPALRFAAGSPMSGPDAAIDPVTHVYTAGSLGSAEDAIEAEDAAGVVVTARVAVGPRVGVTPQLGVVAPGGTIVFVGSGGRPPYAYRLAAAPSGGTIGAADGMYTAGATGDVSDVVIVSDATNDPAAEVRAEVRVTAAVRLYPDAASVAPLESVSFVGLGGQPGYGFSVASSTGATVDANGVYTAGAGGGSGGATDVVTITDDNGQVATATVTVGPTLSLSLLGTDVRPGTASLLVARGGEAPYRYGFAPKGNRSLGTVGEQTGEYVPGPNVGARDRLMVTDAAGALAFFDPVAVGAMQIHVGIGAVRCIAGDFNADGRGDALLVAEDSGYHLLGARTFSLPAGSGAVEREVYLPPARVHDQVVVADFNGTGRDQLAFFGTGGLWSLVPDAGGALVFGPSLPASTFFTTTPTARGYPAALVRGATVNRVVTSAQCGGGAGLWRVDWTVGASAPNPAPVCEPLAYAAAPFAMAASDLNGDGRIDLAWVEQAGANLSYGPVKVALGLAGGGFGATTSYAFPISGAAYVDPWWFGVPDMTFVGTPAGLYLVLVPPGGSSPATIGLLRAGVGGASPSWAPGFPPSLYFPVSGLAPRDATGTRLAAWSTSGSLAFFDEGASGPTPTVYSSVASPSMCATFTDVDGDGTPDFVAGEAASSASDVLLGDGDARYGERPRFAASAIWSGLGDLDGDGAGDLIAASGDRALRVLFGAAGQFAYGPEVTLEKAVVGIGGGDLGDARPSAIVVDESEQVKRVVISADGATMTSTPLGTVSLYYSHPIRVLAHDFGGTAAGLDAMVVTENGDRTNGGRYTATALVRNVVSGVESVSPQSSTILWQERWCDVLPAGTNEAIALCLASDLRSLHLYRSVLSGYNQPWTQLGPLAALTATVGTGALAGAGTLPTGEAVFVASPGSATSPAPVLVVTIAPGGAATITTLIDAAGPVTGALLADLHGSGGRDDLVVSTGGEVRTFLAGTTAGSYVAADRLSAPGLPGAFVRHATGAPFDVVFGTGSALIPVLGDGTGGLQ
jgi:hypothetical protein